MAQDKLYQRDPALLSTSDARGHLLHSRCDVEKTLVHISGSRPSITPPKFHETTPRRRKNEKSGGRGKKKREILGSPPFRAPPFRAPLFLNFGLHPSNLLFGDPQSGAPTLRGTTLRDTPAFGDLLGVFSWNFGGV